MKDVHIGKIIEKVLKDSPVTMVEFTKRLGKSRDIGYKILKKSSINTAELQKIGVILEHDFFQYYSDSKLTPKEASLIRSVTATRADIEEVLTAIKKLAKKK